jgi:uncharacterized tellurite resistance protein B-like protein
MANWQKLAKELLLVDGKIDDKETAVIRGLCFTGNQIDDAELDFLLELKRGAQGVSMAFNQLILDSIKRHILQDGAINPSKADWLRRWIIADGQINPPEKKLLQEIKAGARQTCPEFESLYQKAMAT